MTYDEMMRIIKNQRIFALLLILSCFLVLEPADASQSATNGWVKMYQLNSKNQLVNARWVAKYDNELGCHSLKRAKPIYKFVQIGFRYCRLYQQKHCQQGSEIEMWWDGRRYRSANIDVNQPQLSLLAGDKWVASKHKDNVKILSWQCVL